ncbi:MAG TPA: hypothetical protein VNI79_07900 [Sphingomicrobium sp.]|nr:hypothetical protein [Sphingomicrobium sp.]
MAHQKSPRRANVGGSIASRASSIKLSRNTIKSQPEQQPSLTDDEIMRALWGPGIESTDSIEHMLRLLNKAETDELFWRVFQIGWSSCDDTWSWRSWVLNLLTRRGTVAPFLSGKDKVFYDSLPDLVTIYRGGSAERVRGLAWTTDRNTVAGFARGHRGIAVPNAVIAIAVVEKDAVFTVATDRDEQEVIVNYRRLRKFVAMPYERGAS